MVKKLFFSILLIGAFFLIVLYGYINHQVNQKINIIEPEFITINKGMTISSFSRMLIEKEWIDTRFWLKAYIKLMPELSSLKKDRI